MKKYLQTYLAGAIALAVVISAASLRAQEAKLPPRIGLYDSRAVAYAWFWSTAHQSQLKELMQSARAAQSAGETNRFQELAAAVRQHQDEMHREVFSTAPAREALATLKDRLAEIKKQAGVVVLVSKWDQAELKQHPEAATTDVTEQLVREFIQPTEKQSQTIASLEKSQPLPLDQCNELIRQGKM